VRLVEQIRHARALHLAGLDDVDGDPARAQLLREIPGELRQRGLGRAERDHALSGRAAESGTEIDDASPALSDHGGQDGPRDREGRTHLVVELAAQLFPREVLERLDHVRRERVVDQHIDAAPGRLGPREHAVDRGCLAHAGLHGHGVAAGRLDAGHDLRGRRAAVEVIDHHPHPARGQEARRRRPDSAAGPGHQCHPAGRRSHGPTSCSSLLACGLSA
jgi:hypothetical protein